MSRRLRRRYGRARHYGTSIPWQGTDYIERRYFDIQPTLAYAALGDGAAAQNREAIRKGQALLTWMLSQKAPNARSRRFLDQKVSDVRRLLGKAEAQL